jgi:hypothetical protein
MGGGVWRQLISQILVNDRRLAGLAQGESAGDDGGVGLRLL